MRPISKNVECTYEDGVAPAIFPGLGQYSVEFGSFHNNIAIFVNPEKTFDVDKKRIKTLYIFRQVFILSIKELNWMITKLFHR